MTFRSVEVLRTVEIIACEDTRHSIKLLNHFRISNKLVSYHEHNEHERTDELIDKMLAGASVALISDAGTPAISDPGFVIVKAAIDAGIVVVPVPGAAAFVAAAISSGLPTDALLYGGFLPAKKGDRRRRLQELTSVPATLVFYESPHRIAKMLSDCFEVLGNRRAAVARELTKLHEELVRGTLSELSTIATERLSKGELVIIIERSSKEALSNVHHDKLGERYAEMIAAGVDHKEALKKVAKKFGVKRADAYRQIQMR